MTPETAGRVLEVIREAREALLFLEALPFYLDADPISATDAAATIALSLRAALRELKAVR